MIPTVLYPEKGQIPDDAIEREVYGRDISLVCRPVGSLAELADEECAAADGLAIMRYPVTSRDLARFPRLKVIVRMGVGVDRLDRAAAAAKKILVCNVPDYGTTEVADHAMALVLALRRGIVLYHERMRESPMRWGLHKGQPIRRLGIESFGILGLGRIGTAVALRARAFGFEVRFYDPYLPNGVELALGIARAKSLEALLQETDTLSIHAPLTPETRGILGHRELSLLRQGAVVVNTARGSILDLDALLALLREGHIAGAGIDVLPVEPPVEPYPEILKAYRAREKGLEGRLIITPHAAWFTEQSERDTRTKAAETMRAALLTDRPQNVVSPEIF
jgi:C-terminal binding protein